MKKITPYIIILFMLFSPIVNAQQNSFKIVPLGVKGGLDESNLSAYLVASSNSDRYISLDAGTIYAGISKAIANRVFKGDEISILKNNIKGYLISHAHLDHVSGLIMNAPADSPKTIYSSKFVIDTFKEKYFSWKNWANFTNEGENPQLNKYSYKRLELHKEIRIRDTDLFVTSFSLSHSSPYKSLAFLVGHQENYLLYLGDTGADSIEKSKQLKKLWKEIAPLIKSNKLKAIFIEVSFPNAQDNKNLFGHLKPSLFFQEMNSLSTYTGKASLKNVPIVITHRKPHKNDEVIIKNELLAGNLLGLKLIFPEQGVLLKF